MPDLNSDLETLIQIVNKLALFLVSKIVKRIKNSSLFTIKNNLFISYINCLVRQPYERRM